jgi:hypothetical protein
MKLNSAGKSQSDSYSTRTCEKNVNDSGIWDEARKTPSATRRSEGDQWR